MKLNNLTIIIIIVPLLLILFYFPSLGATDLLKVTNVSISGTNIVDSPMTITATAYSEFGGTVYYRFGIIEDYGTGYYDSSTWKAISEYTTSNSLSYTFTEAGSYIFTVTANHAPSEPDEPKPMNGGCITIKPSGGTGCLDLLEVTNVNISGTNTVNSPMTITATASNECGGTVYYRFGIIEDYGTGYYDPSTWKAISEYTTSNSLSYTFTEAGSYIFTVTANHTPSEPDEPKPMNGGCITIKPPGETLALKVFVAGESVEEFNHMNSKPLAGNGTLNGASNTETEYGWMVPFAERLHIRDANLAVQWTGSSCWLDQESWECSTGAYTSQEIGRTSAQAGSTIQGWQDAHNDELADKQYCYDIAFAARGGNDLDQGVSASAYEAQLRQLVLDLDTGSNCRSHPIIYVTAHLLDTATYNYGYTQDDIDLWMANQKAYYVDIPKRVAEELNTDGRHVRFIDMWTPFHDDLATTAFPSETWWMVNANSVRMPDLDKLHRDSSQHPRRLASIFTGENVADQINIAELWNLLGQ